MTVGEATTQAPVRIARGGWLDVLRFVAAALIILYHFREAAPVALGEVHPVFDRGYLLTNFFIIDSGYVLARIYGDGFAGRTIPLRSYVRQRLLRIVPSHLVVIGTLALLVAAAALAGIAPSNPQWFDWGQLPAQALLMQAYGVPGGQGWNAPTWTLSALLGCYLLLPWICRALWRLGPGTVVVGAVVLLLVADWASRSWLGDPLFRLPLRFGFVRALPLFLLGMAAALMGARRYVAPRWAGRVGLAAMAGFVVAQAIGDLALISLILLTILIWAAGALPVARPSRLIEQLGLMAFAMFLTNEVTRIVWFGAFDALGQADWSLAVRWGVWAAGLITAFVGAAIFRYGFDRPVQAWLNPPRPRTPLPRTSADRPIA
ncbi:acyltransferase family protein [Brevundimonas vesicularis]|jgi:peptidoglycan/LPS O-acetylase OafA/YrhL|uniref:acyltransferase family protein n=1 Tax=Brevundimonas vesicularis TaxID=41276 RepID=UPI0038D51017